MDELGLRVEHAAKRIMWAIPSGLGVARFIGLSCTSARFGRFFSQLYFRAGSVPSILCGLGELYGSYQSRQRPRLHQCGC